MKKTILISTIALCLSITTVHAKPIKNTFDNPKHVIYFNVNSFCVSIVKGDLDTVVKLLDFGEDVNGKSNGLTPAMYAAKFNRTEILKLLIERGANLKTKSTKNKTALYYAELHGAKDTAAIIKEILTKKKK